MRKEPPRSCAIARAWLRTRVTPARQPHLRRFVWAPLKALAQLAHLPIVFEPTVSAAGGELR